MLNQLPKLEKKTGWPWDKETAVYIYSKDIDWPKISIITPSFNQGEYIEESIRSILLQNYPNLEYIIIDGGSTDNTVEIIKKYENHLTYWVSEPDRGQAHAINKGLEKCTGEIFNWINSDDYLENGSLKFIAKEYLEKDLNILMTNTRIFKDSTNDNVLVNSFEIYDSLEETIVFHSINQPGTFIRLDIIKKIGRLNESLNYIFDLEFYIRYFFYYGFLNMHAKDFISTHFRLHDLSKTVGENELFRDEENALWSYVTSEIIKKKKIGKYFLSKTQSIYKPHTKWGTRSLNKKRLLYYLGKRFFFDVYKENKQGARQFFLCLSVKGFFNFDMFIKLAYNLYIKPWIRLFQ